MPTIIDYPQVLRRMIAAGFCSSYPNSGAFGFPDGAAVRIRGWITGADSTIKPALLAQVMDVPPPAAANLAAAAMRVWQKVLPGSAWIMPMSHWHFELRDGSAAHLPSALAAVQVDFRELEDRADGSAVEFAEDESFEPLLKSLLENLKVSDFLLAFPTRAVLCTIHHHCQLWWTTTNPALIGAIDDQLVPQC